MMDECKPFPWGEAMAFAFSVLRLSPAEFWALTPRELALAMAPYQKRRAAPARGELEVLISAFPD